MTGEFPPRGSLSLEFHPLKVGLFVLWLVEWHSQVRPRSQAGEIRVWRGGYIFMAVLVFALIWRGLRSRSAADLIEEGGFGLTIVFEPSLERAH